jgi:hypothetical protein
MVRPQELIDGVLYSLKNSSDIPSDANFIGYEPDIDSQSIKLPLIEVSPVTQQVVSDINSDFVGYKTDSNGDRIGRVYDSLYTMQLTVSVWTAHGSKYSPRDMMDSVRDALYDHETAGPDLPLRKPDGSEIDEVWSFQMSEGEQNDDLGTSPTLRRWEQNLLISASEQYVTDEKPIEGFTLDEETQ